MAALKGLLFKLFWWLWLLSAVYLWLLALYAVPSFLHRFQTGTLPVALIDGQSAAGVAAQAAAAWGAAQQNWPWIHLLAIFASFFVFSLVAALIWWRVRTGFGLLTAYMLLVGGSAAPQLVIYAADLPAWSLDIWQVGALVWPLFFLWLYLFPDGKAVPRRLLWILAPLLSLFAFVFLLEILSGFGLLPEPLRGLYRAAEPYGQPLITILFLTVLAAQFYRYFRVSGPLAREQAKSFLFGLLLAFVPLTLVNIFFDYPMELDTLAFTALPVGIGVAILRYRLWDIDLIIRRTLLYGLLTAVLVAVYFGVVILAQSAFVAFTGQQSPVAIVFSTLTIAVLFHPLRRWLQRVLDRRFFRNRYDAGLVLEQFAATARAEVDIGALLSELESAVQETLQPQSAVLWLARPVAGSGNLPVDS